MNSTRRESTERIQWKSLIAIKSLVVYWESIWKMGMLLVRNDSKQMWIVAGEGLVQESCILQTEKSRGLCLSRVTGQSNYGDQLQ